MTVQYNHMTMTVQYNNVTMTVNINTVTWHSQPSSHVIVHTWHSQPSSHVRRVNVTHLVELCCHLWGRVVLGHQVVTLAPECHSRVQFLPHVTCLQLWQLTVTLKFNISPVFVNAQILNTSHLFFISTQQSVYFSDTLGPSDHLFLNNFIHKPRLRCFFP